jgi:transcription initiation factor TFIID TATA-box-binding protein
MEIRNIIATTELGCRMNLEDIAERVPESQYDAKRFAGLIWRIKEPKATALLFSNGKMVCLGTKSQLELDGAGRKFTEQLAILGYEPNFPTFTIRNVVGSGDCGFKIKLEQLSDDKIGVYIPEFFPALDYRFKNVTCLIFHSGKVIVTGAKRQEEIEEAFAHLYPLLQKYTK